MVFQDFGHEIIKDNHPRVMEKESKEQMVQIENNLSSKNYHIKCKWSK